MNSLGTSLITNFMGGGMCERMHASTLSPGFCKIVRSMIEAVDLKLKCRFLVMVTVFHMSSNGDV